jgi:hypothetical protein
VLGVAVGVASVLATALASRAAVASLTDDVEALAGDARLEVTRPGGVPLADMARLAPLCGEVQVAPVVEGTALLPGRGEVVHLFGVDMLGAADRGFAGTLDAEAWDRFLRREGVFLARAAAERLGVRAHDALELVVQARRVSLEVLAQFEPQRLASAWERVLVVDVALAQELLERAGRVDRLELAPRAGVAFDEEAVAERARALLPPGTSVGPASDPMASHSDSRHNPEGPRSPESSAYLFTHSLVLDFLFSQYLHCIATPRVHAALFPCFEHCFPEVPVCTSTKVCQHLPHSRNLGSDRSVSPGQTLHPCRQSHHVGEDFRLVIHHATHCISRYKAGEIARDMPRPGHFSINPLKLILESWGV